MVKPKVTVPRAGSYLVSSRWFSSSDVQRLKRIEEDMTHSEGRHAFTVHLVNINTHVQQQVDHIIVAVYLTETEYET